MVQRTKGDNVDNLCACGRPEYSRGLCHSCYDETLADVFRGGEHNVECECSACVGKAGCERHGQPILFDGLCQHCRDEDEASLAAYWAPVRRFARWLFSRVEEWARKGTRREGDWDLCDPWISYTRNVGPIAIEFMADWHMQADYLTLSIGRHEVLVWGTDDERIHFPGLQSWWYRIEEWLSLGARPNMALNEEGLCQGCWFFGSRNVCTDPGCRMYGLEPEVAESVVGRDDFATHPAWGQGQEYTPDEIDRMEDIRSMYDLT